MATPAMDSTGVTAEPSRSAEISHSPSVLPEVSKPDSESPRLSSLPPYFRSYEAYIEHCMAIFEREEIPEAAFDRLCARCTAAFKKIAELRAGGETIRDLPFCTVNEFLRSAAEGNCHVCHWLMAETLRRWGSARLSKIVVKPIRNLTDVESKESGVEALGHGDAALTLIVFFNRNGTCTGHLQITIVGADEELPHLNIQVSDSNYSRARGFPTALNTAGDASWNQALKWIEICRSHPLCNPVQTANAQDKWPARLVAVGVIGDAHVRICETSRPGFVEKSYMTLSHCWGKNGVPIRLLEENHATFLNGIQLGELPNTFRDAIELTRKLKIPFIWIDSLCIIQNSHEDWIQESAKMQQVYRNSFLNLAAGASSDSSGGLFYQRDPLSVVPWSIRIGEDRYLMGEYINEHARERLVAELILYTRGWVLQEQLLARRTLVFGQKELHWECSTCQASESFPDLNDRPTFRYTIFRPDWENLLEGKLVDSKRQEAWDMLIMTYSSRSLTKPSDRLVAISGLAEQLSSRWSGITYLAGLWSYRLIQGLLWRCGRPCSRITEIAPSWSWASLIQERNTHLNPSGSQFVDALAEVLEAKVAPETRTSPFGYVACGGSIKLRGPILRARITTTNFDEDCRLYNLALEDNCNLETHVPDTSIRVFWDEISDAKDDIKDAYLAPFQIQNEFLPNVCGLVLLKTVVHSCTTQFRRAGYFSFYDLSDEENDLIPEIIFEGLRKKGLFRDIDSWFAERVGEGPEERMNYLKKDPYVNGPPLNTTLEHRYPPKFERAFPGVSRFLKAIARVAKNNKANGTPDPVLGMGEGNGYYTYEIV